MPSADDTSYCLDLLNKLEFYGSATREPYPISHFTFYYLDPLRLAAILLLLPTQPNPTFLFHFLDHQIAWAFDIAPVVCLNTMVSDRHNIPGNTWRPGYAQFNQEPTDYPPGKPAHPHSNSGLGTNLPSISSLSSHAHPHDSLPPINAHLSHKSSFSAPSSASAPSATTQIWPGSSTFSSTSAGPPSSFQSQRPVEERNASDNGYQYSQKHEPGIRHASSLPVSLPQQESRYDYLNRSSHNPSNNHPYSSYSTYSQDAGAHGTHVMHGSSQQQASLPPLPQYPNQQHNDFK